MAVLELTNNKNASFEIGTTAKNPPRYRCHLAILRESDGTFSVAVLNLPGAGSCGDTEEEAIANSRKAIAGIIESFLADKEDIPWEDPTTYTIPEGAKQKWVLVDV